MKLATFFEKFELFADAPSAVAKMRELVLQLAFSGGLTGATVSNGDLPTGWAKRSIQSIAASISPGFACSKSHQIEGGHVHLRTHNISTLGTLNFDLMVRIDPKLVDPQKASIQAGDILFNNTNSQELVGKTSLVDQNYNYGFSNHITRIRLNEGVYPGFVAYYLTLLRNSGYFSRLCTRWINQAAVNTETLKQQTIPLPPLAEQRRIVAKVDELMALCDRLATQQQDRETRHAALARAALARFADAPTPANLEFLFHPAYTIDPADLRKTILTLAVQGKLVPQDPDDEPAEVLLFELRSERRRLWEVAELAKFAAASKVPKDDRWKERYETATKLEYDELPELPATWTWLSFDEIVPQFQYGPRFGVEEYVSDGIPTVRTTDMDYRGRVRLKDAPRVRVPRQAESHWCLQPDDLLITRTGATIGKCALYDQSWGRAIASAYLIRFRLTRQTVCPRFVLLYLMSPHGQSLLLTGATEMAQPNVNATNISRFPFPLPPLAEQRRIVAKVDKLMALVDQLETQLAARRAAAERLLAALVAELTSAPTV